MGGAVALRRPRAVQARNVGARTRGRVCTFVAPLLRGADRRSAPVPTFQTSPRDAPAAPVNRALMPTDALTASLGEAGTAGKFASAATEFSVSAANLFSASVKVFTSKVNDFVLLVAGGRVEKMDRRVQKIRRRIEMIHPRAEIIRRRIKCIHLWPEKIDWRS